MFAFIKKEFMENVRTYRIYIMAAVFFLIGIMNPLTALLLPRLLETMDLGPMQIALPDATAFDSWAQFFSNISMGMFAFAISFAGIIANELSRGTLVNLLTKGLKRSSVIWAKFISSSIMWTISYLICLGITWVYTVFYWPGEQLHHAAVSFFAPWLFGVLIIALLIFGGVLLGIFTGSLMFTGGVMVILNLLQIIPDFRRFNPATLISGTFNLLNGNASLTDFAPALIISSVAAIAIIVLSVMVFNKKKI